MAESVADLFEICKVHLDDKQFLDELPDQFVIWVRDDYLKNLKTHHQIPTGYVEDVREEIDLQIDQWLRVKLYGKTLIEYRKNL